MKIVTQSINQDIDSCSSDATLVLQDSKKNIITLRIVLFSDYESYTVTITDINGKILKAEEYEEFLLAKRSKYGDYFYKLMKIMSNSKT